MAEEKKPNLKDRLKKTAVANPSAAAQVGPPQGMQGVQAPIMPPVRSSVQPPAMGGGDFPPLAGIPGIPGLGSDVAPPAFVQQQQAADAARARAAAVAADPFSSSAVAHGAHQEMRLVIDDKAVEDHEVGRGRAGTIVALVAVGLLAGAGGYVGGGQLEIKKQEHRTVAAVADLRTQLSHLSDTINAIKTHVDTAAEHGNITVQRDDEGGGGQPAAAATHPPDVDDALVSWFREQPPEPPFSPDTYAGRVPLLRSQVISKLIVVQLQFNEVWRQLGVHVLRTGTGATVRAALAAAAPQNNVVRGAVITFVHPNADAPPLGILVAADAPNAQGLLPIHGQGIPANATRTPFQTGDIAMATLPTFAFPLAANQGIAPQVQGAATAAWGQYRQRITDLKGLVDQLVANEQQLLESLNH